MCLIGFIKDTCVFSLCLINSPLKIDHLSIIDGCQRKLSVIPYLRWLSLPTTHTPSFFWTSQTVQNYILAIISSFLSVNCNSRIFCFSYFYYLFYHIYISKKYKYKPIGQLLAYSLRFYAILLLARNRSFRQAQP